MANISDAKGYINISKKFIEKVFLNSKKEYMLFTEHFRKTMEEEVYYSTTITDEEENFDETGISIPFYAEGRWSFQNNLNWFNERFCVLYPVDEVLLDEHKLETNEMLQRWKDDPELYITFEFTDFEIGEPFLYEGIVKINFKEICSSSYHDYEVTKENLVKLDYYDIYGCVDIKKEVTFEKFYEDANSCSKSFSDYDHKLQKRAYDDFMKDYGEMRFMELGRYQDEIREYCESFV